MLSGLAGATVRLRGTLVGGAHDRVLAMRCDGTTTTANVGAAGGFRITLPSPVAGDSMQLIDGASRYAGPVVLRRLHSRGALTFAATRSGSYQLGGVRVGDGFATVTGALPPALKSGPRVVELRTDGAPAGAATMGLGPTVRSASTRCASRKNGLGADPDRDGIPNAFDVDGNGNGILDAIDPLTFIAPTLRPTWTTTIAADAAETINARVSAAYDQTAKDRLKTGLGVMLGSAAGATAACTAVSFCHGTLQLPATFAPALDDTVGQLPVGQTLLVAANDRATPLAVPPFILTEPAITGLGFDDGAPENIAYPPTSGGSAGQPRTVPSLDMVIRWMRPQRPPITDAERAAFAGNLANLHDEYGLRYSAVVTVGDTSYDCRGDALDEGNDPNLEVANAPTGPEFLDDQNARGPDGVALIGDVDLGRCQTAQGQRVSDALVGHGPFTLAFSATDLAGDRATQRWYLYF